MSGNKHRVEDLPYRTTHPAPSYSRRTRIMAAVLITGLLAFVAYLLLPDFNAKVDRHAASETILLASNQTAKLRTAKGAVTLHYLAPTSSTVDRPSVGPTPRVYATFNGSEVTIGKAFIELDGCRIRVRGYESSDGLPCVNLEVQPPAPS